MTDELARLLQDLRHRTAERLTEEAAVEKFGRRTVSMAEETGLIDLDAGSDERILWLTAQGRIRLMARPLSVAIHSRAPNRRSVGTVVGTSASSGSRPCGP